MYNKVVQKLVVTPDAVSQSQRLEHSLFLPRRLASWLASAHSIIQPTSPPPLPLFFSAPYPTSPYSHSLPLSLPSLPHEWTIFSQLTPNVNSCTYKAPQHSSSRLSELKSITPLMKIWINDNEAKFILTLRFLNKSWLLFTQINPDQFDNFHLIWLLHYQPKKATPSLYAFLYSHTGFCGQPHHWFHRYLCQLNTHLPTHILQQFLDKVNDEFTNTVTTND